MKIMVACPAPVGVTSPVLLTVATAVLSLLHVPPVNARPSDATAVICSVAPKSTLLLGALTVTVRLVSVGDVDVLPPHAAAEISRSRTQPRWEIRISRYRLDCLRQIYRFVIGERKESGRLSACACVPRIRQRH